MPLDQHEDPFEGRLGDALRQAGDSFETDGHTMVDGGVVRGRRLLFRQRAAMLGGVAGIALIGVGGAVLLPGIGDGGGEGDGKRSVAAERSGEQTVSDDDGEVSGAEMVQRLKNLMPKGKFSGESARGTGTEPGPYAHVVYDDGNGAAAVELGLGRIDPDSEHARQLTECPDKAVIEYDSCKESTRPDGSRLMLFEGYEYPDRRVDTKFWYAQVVDPEDSKSASGNGTPGRRWTRRSPVPNRLSPPRICGRSSPPRSGRRSSTPFLRRRRRKTRRSGRSRRP